MTSQGNITIPLLTSLQQFQTFRQPPITSIDEQQRQDLLVRIYQLEREIEATNQRARQLEKMNSKLNQIIVDHHTKDEKDAQRFLEKVDRILERRRRGEEKKNSSRDKTNEKWSNSKIKESPYHKEERGRVRTQQSFTDQNCSFIGNCSAMTRIDLKRKVASKLATTYQR